MFRYRFSPKKLYPQGFLTLALLSALLVNGYLEQGATLAAPAKQHASPEPSLSSIELSQARPTARPDRQIVRRVRLDLSERFNVSRQSLKMISFSRETWSNGCLGFRSA